jgi:alditol oxidase
VTITNWAGNVTFRPARFHRPESIEALRALVAGSSRLRALGSGHSFNEIAATEGDLVSVAALPPAFELDTEHSTVRVAAGLRYGDVASRLHRAGYALPNLGSLPHISIAGACATGTHGSGDRNGSLATAVNAIELVTADGQLRTLSRAADGDRFAGAVVALGALGVVTSVTLDVVPTFDIAQTVYLDLPRAALDEHFDAVMASAYSVSLFTDWSGPAINQVWRKRLASDAAPAPELFGAVAAGEARHPLPGVDPQPCTDQLGVPGPWHLRLPHFRLEFTPSSGDELQSEFFVARRDAVRALAALDPVSARIAAVLQISEIRSIAADDLWLSPAYERDSVAIHFTWIRDAAAVAPVVALVEEALAPFDARPHWGKVFHPDAALLRGLYPRLADFGRLRAQLDPAGLFGNDWLDACLR